MRYFFESVVEKKEKGYMIRIPFNVWEVSKHRDVIQGEVVLDNRIIECELLPIDKGNYEIHIADNDAVNVEPGITHKILLHITGSLIRMDQNSPYDFEHPIREIDSMKVIIQPEDGLCGQACVAMLAGNTIAEVISVMDCREWQATMGRMISALNYYGIDHSDVINYTEGRDAVLPKCCILMEKMGRFCHYLIHYDGKYYDSNLGVLEEYDMSKLLGYLEIKCN
ncbi:hypothetical protein NSB25_04430 [Acetatifactor muris]|jgi:hypothetical protein|uniref:DUF1905 domain-containing protein n=1 Tax=Acetatifactor muris TaxID=879566 RepID=A0A2K4ZBS2_9FIRM|nr:hypothetical protein [Acetatifactor muris]MCI8801645.1 hypothetical protein [Lachnospiraceae bacterium]MCR2046524.1 hypothetical protein [Acetatifactor muris]SOY27908.1 hypothetical protein AMURIS_00613 [Acetatifactor muris]